MSTIEDDDEIRNSHSIIALKVLILTSVTVEGLYRYIPGPTLIDLVGRMFEPIRNVVLLYCARSIGQIIGIILGSFIFQWLLQSKQKSLFLFLSLFIMSVTFFFISIVIEFDEILLLFCASGVSKGLLNTGINAICLHSKMFENYFLSLIACFYGFGALLSPLLARNYVTERVNITADNIGFPLKNYTELMDMREISYQTPISKVYIIIGALMLVVALLWLVHYIVAAGYAMVTEPKWLDWKKGSTIVVWNLIILNASILTFVSEAIAFGYAQVLPSYMVIHWKEHQQDSLNFLIVFLAFFCIGRIAGWFFSTEIYYKISPTIMLFVSVFLLFCGCLVLYMDTECDRTLLFIAQAVLGIGISTFFINNYLWLCCKIFITHRSMNLLFIMESLSELIIPWALSKYMWSHPQTIRHFMAVATSVITVLYGIQYFCLFGMKLEKCPNCVQKSISRELPLPTMRQIAEIHPAHTPHVTKSESEEEQHSPEFLRFINRQKVLDDLSEIEKRIQQSNKKVKSAIQQLEYTLKP